MKGWGPWWLWLSALALSCARPPTPSPPPTAVHSIAVLPPHNRTDDPLLIASESYWDPVARRSRPVTVADALAAEARAQLEQHGFSVVSPEHVEKVIGTHPPGSPQEAAELAAQGQLSGSLLYIDILRWEPDLRIRPERILVALQVSLIDAATGQVIWTDHHALHPVPTRGAINLWNAYLIAAHDVVASILSPWGSGHPSS